MVGKKIEDYQKAGQEIYDKLHLATYPVAIKYFKDEKEIPKNVTKPYVTGKKMSICQIFAAARKLGQSYALSSKDNFCTPSSVGHGWVPITKEEFIESQVRQGWHKDEQAEKRRAEKIYMKNYQNLIELGYRGVIASPLPESVIMPDTVLIYGNGAQITHIVHALNYEHKERYAVRSAFEGFGESCGKGGFMPFLTRKPQIVVPGSGDRAFAGIQDYEIGIGMPGKHIFYVLENLFKTGGHQGLGFPIRSLIPMGLDENITPGFKYMREIIDKKLEETEIEKKGR
ncbi:MAG: hypothetical protein GF383_00365 [Candidatus Lokiarchaeota archaeon]|nr:hypothetical protein [Candidatus Lokiarchaeota archaeon]MBD3337596.1 hypothetical protein [Candidatus Lokiarchaeota archaeon]